MRNAVDRRDAGILLVTCLWMLVAAPCVVAQSNGPGIDAGGNMVAYNQPIPGTDIHIEMIPVPGGTLRQDDETAVKIAAFWIGKHEVTCAQYGEFMKLHDVFAEFDEKRIRQLASLDAADGVSAPTAVYDPNCRFDYSTRLDSPAPSMSQFAARQFTKWLSLLSGIEYRLPNERQWKYACLAGRQPHSSDESELREQAVFGNPPPDQYKSQREQILRVGTKRANRWGIHDMQGNVAEYVIEDSLFDDQPQRSEGYRVHRAYGGCFADPTSACQWNSFVIVDRDWWQEDADFPVSPMWIADVDRHATVGFRMIRSTIPMTDAMKRIAWEPDSEKLANANRERIETGRQRCGRVDPDLPAAIPDNIKQTSTYFDP